LTYWEIFNIFTSEYHQIDVSFGTTEPLSSLGILAPSKALHPHSRTGVGGEVLAIFLEVGRLLISRSRRRVLRNGLVRRSDLVKAEEDIKFAEAMEAKLLCLALPEEKDIVDPTGVETPFRDLLQMGEGYRHTALQQLYRAFPDLLENRLRFPPSFPECEMFGNNHIIIQEGQNDNEISQAMDNRLKDLALFSLNNLASITADSRTICFQTAPLLCLSSELRLPNRARTPNSQMIPDFTNDGSFITVDEEEQGLEELRILQVREFVLRRLTASQQPFPGNRVDEYVKHVRMKWSEMDLDMDLRAATS
jgi:hypothetical protein